MKKIKILYILNTANKVNNFSYSSMIAAQKLGYEFHIAGNWTGYDDSEQKEFDEEKYGIKIHQIDFIRKPYDLKNFKAFRQLCKLVEKEKYDVIHCNTPIGGVIGRLVGKKYGVDRIIYQAHGFHFYKGAPLINWLIYYPIERWLAHYTDCLITINREDYQLALKFKLRENGKVYKVHGVGIDLKLYANIMENKEAKKRELGLQSDDFVCIAAGDLVKRKNYPTSIEAFSKIENKKIYYIICGEGPEQKKLKKIADNKGVAERVLFLGYRTDIMELMKISDVFLFTTLQEGMPRSMMEAMACGLPCIASKIRGNIDLLIDVKGGYIKKTNDVDGLKKSLETVMKDERLRKEMGKYNLKRIQRYDVNIVENEMKEIYMKEINKYKK